MKPSNSEKRRWATNKRILVKKRERSGKCAVCKKKLSIYTIGDYCNSHRMVQKEIEDLTYLEKQRVFMKKYRERNKEYYHRKLKIKEN